MGFYQDLKLEPTQQLIKIEKIDYTEEGIDCENPAYLRLLTQVQNPYLKDVYESFLDSESKYLITFSDKIYFTPLTEFMSKAESNTEDLNTFMFGNTNEFRLLEETNSDVDADTKDADAKATADAKADADKAAKDAEAKSKAEKADAEKDAEDKANSDNPDETDDSIDYTDIKDFNSIEFDYSTEYKDSMRKEIVKYFSVKDTQNDTIYHLFFTQQYMIIINVDQKMIKIKDLGIKAHSFNEHTVSKKKNLILFFK